MKPTRLFLTLAALAAVLASTPARAQEGGTPIKITTTLHDDGSRTEIQRDVDNRRAEARTLSASNKLLQRWVYTLDAQGRETEGICYDAKDKVIARAGYKYDPFGRVNEVTEMNAAGTVQRRIQYKRDATGRVLATDVLDAAGNPVTPRATPTPRKTRTR